MATNGIHLPYGEARLVKDIPRRHLRENESVFVFGSRPTGRQLKKASDLDLCVRGPARLGVARWGKLRQAFVDSDLPIRVEVVDWHDADGAFRHRIEPAFVELRWRDEDSTRDR